MDKDQIKYVVEAALLAAGRPLSVDSLHKLFGDDDAIERSQVRQAIQDLEADYEGRGITVKRVASGFRIQVRESVAQWLARLWEERPPRYSRALMETLAIIAYRHPITRGEIEEIRGVSVSTNIARTLLERGWVRIVGHRDVPGKPALYATTREFLDYFDLKKLDDLPQLADLTDLDKLNVQLELGGEEAVDADPDHEAEPDTDADENKQERVTTPGAPEQLVSAPPSDLPDEPATVASLVDARNAAADTHGHSSSHDKPDPGHLAEVVPLKTS